MATVDPKELLVPLELPVLKVSKVPQGVLGRAAPREIRDGLECLGLWAPLDLLVQWETMDSLVPQVLLALREAWDQEALPDVMVKPELKAPLA